MPCNGNSEEICGGPNRLSTYQFGNGTLPTSSATPSPAATTSSVPLPTDLPSNWTYQGEPFHFDLFACSKYWTGCWIDNANGRVMNTQLPDDSSLTVQSCIAKCSNAGYSVAGMEYASQCFCDNYLRMGATNASDSDCNMACAGNSAEKCGAGNRLSVYSNSSLTVYPVPSPQKTNLTGSWNYTGCLADDAQLRALPYQLILQNNNTANNCLSQCSAFGYNAGGMEYGLECS
jgi:hypothetical protein